jgi:hypothetical protein
MPYVKGRTIDANWAWISGIFLTNLPAQNKSILTKEQSCEQEVEQK